MKLQIGSLVVLNTLEATWNFKTNSWYVPYFTSENCSENCVENLKFLEESEFAVFLHCQVDTLFAHILTKNGNGWIHPLYVTQVSPKPNQQSNIDQNDT